MRLLLDESLPRKLRDQLQGHDVRAVAELGWSGLRNGDLLQRAALEFDALVTADQNLQFQQNLATLPVAVIVLCAQHNKLESLRPLVEPLLEALSTLTPRTLLRIGG